MGLTPLDFLNSTFPWFVLMTQGIVLSFWVLPPGPKGLWILASPFYGNKPWGRMALFFMAPLFGWVTDILGLSTAWREVGLGLIGLWIGWLGKMSVCYGGQHLPKEPACGFGLIKRTFTCPLGIILWTPLALLWVERPMPAAWFWSLLSLPGVIHCVAIQGSFWSRFVPPESLSQSESDLLDRVFAFASLKERTALQAVGRLGIPGCLQSIQASLLFATFFFFLGSRCSAIPTLLRTLISLILLAAMVFLWQRASQLLHRAQWELEAAWIDSRLPSKSSLGFLRHWKIVFFASTFFLAMGQFQDVRYGFWAFLIEALLVGRFARPCWQEAARMRKFSKLAQKPLLVAKQKRQLVALVDTMLFRQQLPQKAPIIEVANLSLQEVDSKAVGSRKRELLPKPNRHQKAQRKKSKSRRIGSSRKPPRRPPGDASCPV